MHLDEAQSRIPLWFKRMKFPFFLFFLININFQPHFSHFLHSSSWTGLTKSAVPNALNILKYHKNEHAINKERFIVTRVTLLKKCPQIR